VRLNGAAAGARARLRRLHVRLQLLQQLVELVLLDRELVHHAHLVDLDAHLRLVRGVVHALGVGHRAPGERDVVRGDRVVELVERREPAVHRLAPPARARG
jgi:hypothetical protein